MTIALAIALLAAPVMASPRISKNCIPKRYGNAFVTKAAHLTTVKRVNGALYHFFAVTDHRGSKGIIVTLQSGGTCGEVWSDPGGEGGSFLATIPKSVAYPAAREIARKDLRDNPQWIKDFLRVGGSVPPEWYQAYKSLGLDVSKLTPEPMPRGAQ